MEGRNYLRKIDGKERRYLTRTAIRRIRIRTGVKIITKN